MCKRMALCPNAVHSNCTQPPKALSKTHTQASLPCHVAYPTLNCSNWTGPPMAVLLNKADLVPPETVEELKTWYKENCRAKEVGVPDAGATEGGM